MNVHSPYLPYYCFYSARTTGLFAVTYVFTVFFSLPLPLHHPPPLPFPISPLAMSIVDVTLDPTCMPVPFFSAHQPSTLSTLYPSTSHTPHHFIIRLPSLDRHDPPTQTLPLPLPLRRTLYFILRIKYTGDILYLHVHILDFHLPLSLLPRPSTFTYPLSTCSTCFIFHVAHNLGFLLSQVYEKTRTMY